MWIERPEDLMGLIGAVRRAVRVLVRGREHGLRARLRARFVGGAPAARGAPEPEESARVSKSWIAPDGYVGIGGVESFRPGELVEATVGDASIVVVNVDGDFFAVSNICPHAGGPIGDGSLEGHHVRCLYHGWTFDVRSGQCSVDESMPLPTYDVRVIDGIVCVARASGPQG